MDLENASGTYTESAGLTTASTTWSEGNGINGDVLRPENLDSLAEILDRVEFEASINSESYVYRSNLESRIYAFDQDGDSLFTQNASHHAEDGFSSTGGSITNSASFIDSSYYLEDDSDIITTSETHSDPHAEYSTDVDYAGGIQDNYQIRKLITNIGNNVPTPLAP